MKFKNPEHKHMVDFREAGHIYKIAGTKKIIPSSTQIPKGLVVKRDGKIYSIYPDFEKICQDDQALKGTLRHNYNAYRMMGWQRSDIPHNGVDDLIDECEIQIAQVLQYRDKVFAVELPGYTPDPFYAWTIDLILRHPGPIYQILDWKTTHNKEHALQLSSYKMGVHKAFDIPLDNIMIGVVDLKGKTHDLSDDFQEYWETYNHMAKAYNYIIRGK